MSKKAQNKAYVDREGREIEVGMAVAMAVTMNQTYTNDSYTIRICKERDGKLILDGAHNWAYLEDMPANELQVLHEGVDLAKLDLDFTERFKQANAFDSKNIRTHDAHVFYNDVFKALQHVLKNDLDIRDAHQAKRIIIRMLEASSDSDEKVEIKIDRQRIKMATAETLMAEAKVKVTSILDGR